MSLHLLALPFFADGTVVLRGKWPEYIPHLHDVMDILHEFGLRITIGADKISSRMGNRPKQSVPGPVRAARNICPWCWPWPWGCAASAP